MLIRPVSPTDGGFKDIKNDSFCKRLCVKVLSLCCCLSTSRIDITPYAVEPDTLDNSQINTNLENVLLIGTQEEEKFLKFDFDNSFAHLNLNKQTFFLDYVREFLGNQISITDAFYLFFVINDQNSDEINTDKVDEQFKSLRQVTKTRDIIRKRKTSSRVMNDTIRTIL